MQVTVRPLHACLLVLFLFACRTRPYELSDADAPPRDLAVAPDLSVPRDLTVLPDFTPPPDLTPPHYCDGIFVFDQDNRFAFFDPKALQFHDISTLKCPAGGASPFSMGLRNDGVAFVEYDNGELFSVDSYTGACTPTKFRTGQQGFGDFGMGFAADAPNSKSETLYIAGFQPIFGLGSIDTNNLVVSKIANLPGGAELTGTGAGELWGFFGDTSAHAGRIDKMTGAISPDFPLSKLGDVSRDGYAFGFFGGTFYIFLLPPNSTTTVYGMDPQNGQLRTVLTNTGRHVVGAGVSTCAPQM